MAGYMGMLKGKLNVISGLAEVQKIGYPLMPIMPKATMLDFVYEQ